jgi:hypothetical protein
MDFFGGIRTQNSREIGSPTLFRRATNELVSKAAAAREKNSRLFKVFSEKRTLGFRGQFFNAFNHVQYADPATDFRAANFRYIQSTSVAPRMIQLAAKIQF